MYISQLIAYVPENLCDAPSKSLEFLKLSSKCDDALAADILASFIISTGQRRKDGLGTGFTIGIKHVFSHTNIGQIPTYVENQGKSLQVSTS